jgi:tRNA 5-methylaminomethyl-2-thiouridine biosynthesis bifunctional protein
MPISYGGYLTPAIDGQHILGATYTDGLDTETTDTDHAENIERLRSALPDLADDLSDHRIDGRASIRTTVKDRFPIIGQLPDQTVWPGTKGYVPGLYTLTGLGSHGVIGSSIGGRVIGHLITGSPPPLPRNIVDHLNPSRFLYRR